jgi:hypothetical protein
LKTFEIIFNNKNEKKVILYECYTADNCSEILAKLNFLRVINIKSYLKLLILGIIRENGRIEKVIDSCFIKFRCTYTVIYVNAKAILFDVTYLIVKNENYKNVIIYRKLRLIYFIHIKRLLFE